MTMNLAVISLFIVFSRLSSTLLRLATTSLETFLSLLSFFSSFGTFSTYSGGFCTLISSRIPYYWTRARSRLPIFISDFWFSSSNLFTLFHIFSITCAKRSASTNLVISSCSVRHISQAFTFCYSSENAIVEGALSWKFCLMMKSIIFSGLPWLRAEWADGTNNFS